MTFDALFFWLELSLAVAVSLFLTTWPILMMIGLAWMGLNS